MNYKNEKNTDKKKLFWIYTNDILNKSLDEINNEVKNIILVDPTDRLYKYEKKINFSDSIHLTSHGNEIIADEIFLIMKKNLKLLF